MIKSWRNDQKVPPLVPEVLSRRSMLTGVLLALAGLGLCTAAALAQSKPESSTAEADEIAAAEKVARDGKLGPLRHSTSEHFLAIGNAPDEHRQAALKLCESLGQDFLAHFRKLGFKLAYPDHRLTIVTLKDAPSYAVFLGKEPDQGRGRLLRPRYQAALDLRFSLRVPMISRRRTTRTNCSHWFTRLRTS